MIDWLLSEFGGWLAGAGAVVAVLVTARWRGRASGKQQTALEAAEAYGETRRRMDIADTEIHGADPDAARRLMRERDVNQR